MRSTVTFYLSSYIFSSASYPKFLNQMRKVLAASYFFFFFWTNRIRSGCGIETNKIHFLFFILCLIIIIMIIKIVTNGTGMKKKNAKTKLQIFENTTMKLNTLFFTILANLQMTNISFHAYIDAAVLWIKFSYIFCPFSES